jgi:hypothetical protein
MFISSNPSIDDLKEEEREMYPADSWEVDRISHFFDFRFDEFVIDGIRPVRGNGLAASSVAFWSSVRARAKELFARTVLPGVDYALTEVVHCKSRSERGVLAARDTCISHHFERVMTVSGAEVVVVLGVQAAAAFPVEWRAKVDQPEGRLISADLGGRPRSIVFLSHPNARGPRKLTNPRVLAPSSLATLREILRDA